VFIYFSYISSTFNGRVRKSGWQDVPMFSRCIVFPRVKEHYACVVCTDYLLCGRNTMPVWCVQTIFCVEGTLCLCGVYRLSPVWKEHYACVVCTDYLLCGRNTMPVWYVQTISCVCAYTSHRCTLSTQHKNTQHKHTHK
jgi:hypothetical protein